MLRKLLTSLFCSLLLAAQSYSQDVFIPRELKAQAVHPVAVKEPATEETKAPKKEVVRRAQPVTEADLKAEATAAKTDKAPAKEKSSATVKVEKAPPAKEEPAGKTVAKTEIPKTEPSKEKEKVVAVKEKPAKSEPATVKVEKAIPVKQEPASKTVAKNDAAKPELAKEKTEKPAAVKEEAAKPATAKTQPAKAEAATVKTEKVIPAKEESASKAVAKNDTAKPDQPKEKAEKPAAVKEKAATDSTAKVPTVKNEAATAKAEKKEDSSSKHAAKTESVKVETVTAKTEKAPAKDKPAAVVAAKTQKEEKTPPAKEETVNKAVAKTETVKTEPATPKTDKLTPVKEKPANVTARTQLTKPEALPAKVETPRPPAEGPITVAKTTTMKVEQVSVPSQKEPPQIIPAMTTSLETGLTKIADGFDFPIGKPDAEGYYKARGFRPGGHVGEDWDGTRGGDTDLKDPIFSIGDGIVVFARDVHLGWGNVIIVRHAYRENGIVKYIDALYGHLNTMLVGRGQKVSRGQQIATMGTAHGQYDAHLHFEIRKNLEIGMSRSKFQKSFSNYYDPSQFIASHRRLSGGGANYKVAMNTFTHDWMYKFDSNRNFSSRKRSTSESSAALRRAVTSR